jgi:MOSC domain-containing protein YiiM
VQGIIEQVSTSNGGVPKFPVLHANITSEGIEGDKHKHPQYHGGPDKALLVITAEGLAELKTAGFPVYPGALGENLTTRGLDRRFMRPGQRYRAGSALLLFTRMRRPCEQLNPYGGNIQNAIFDASVKAGDPSSPRWGLGGFYAAVIEPGEIWPGDIIALVD